MWFAAQVTTGQELWIKKVIEDRGLKAAVPVDVVRKDNRADVGTFMPGYVFFAADRLDPSVYYLVREIPGVIRVFRTEIPEEQISKVLELTGIYVEITEAAEPQHDTLLQKLIEKCRAVVEKGRELALVRLANRRALIRVLMRRGRRVVRVPLEIWQAVQSGVLPSFAPIEVPLSP